MSATTASMPSYYNTRRKSISLPSLGINLPVTNAERALARISPPSAENPPPKKIKLSPSMSPPPKRDPIKYEHTPPPSPEAEAEAEDEVKPREIDLEGVNDDIVEAVILHLQKSFNRPALVKELAAVLSTQVKIVETSANPAAIISSRLSSYLKRSWNAQSPCPLAKELETVHPRRTYFYLTTYPHQPIPDPHTNPYAAQRTIISPSLSSAASRSDEAEAERRRELSPSPEVDLSSPELEDDHMVTPPTPTGSFSGRVERVQNTRASSPPLEKDEKEFTQTARGMQKRKFSDDTNMSGIPSDMAGHPTKNIDGDSFFGEGRHLDIQTQAVFVSSPAMKPSLAVHTLKRPFEENDPWAKDGAMEWDMRSPEHVDLDELDGMLDDF